MLRRGDRVEIFEKSENEGWQSYMDEYVGVHGVVTTSINGPDALVEVSLHRFPQDCIRKLEG